MSELVVSSVKELVESSRRNRVEVALHLVWKTYQRMPLLTDALERVVYRTIEAEAQRQGCTVLALNGTMDHVHVVLTVPATISISLLMKQLKGVSSSVARDHLGTTGFFRWADGYAAFSLSRRHCESAIAYVEHQKERHAEGRVQEDWEDAPDSA